MIRKMLNLRCPAGHRYFARDPSKWEGRTCGKTDPDDTKRSYGCQERLHAVKPGA